MCVWGAGGVQCTLYSLVNGPSTQHCRLCHDKSPPLCHTLKDIHIHMVEQLPGTSVIAMQCNAGGVVGVVADIIRFVSVLS